jgi:hypothetical protein
MYLKKAILTLKKERKMKPSLFVLLIWLPLSSFSSFPEDLSSSSLQEIDKGKILLFKEKMKDSPWPKLTVYKLIEASPLEAAAIFMAFDHQKNYVIDIIKSTPIEMDNPRSILVEYERNNPWPVPNDHYTNLHHFKKIKQGYYIEWTAVKSKQAKSVNGEAYFIEYKKKTLLKYVIAITPKSKLAGLVTKSMINKTKESLQGIADYIAHSKQFKLTLMSKYKKMLEDALKGIWSYKAILTNAPNKN